MNTMSRAPKLKTLATERPAHAMSVTTEKHSSMSAVRNIMNARKLRIVSTNGKASRDTEKHLRQPQMQRKNSFNDAEVYATRFLSCFRQSNRRSIVTFTY